MEAVERADRCEPRRDEPGKRALSLRRLSVASQDHCAVGGPAFGPSPRHDQPEIGLQPGVEVTIELAVIEPRTQPRSVGSPQAGFRRDAQRQASLAG